MQSILRKFSICHQDASSLFAHSGSKEHGEIALLANEYVF